jgi:hypothetical protein
LVLAGGIGNRARRIEDELDADPDLLARAVGAADEVLVLQRLPGWPLPAELVHAHPSVHPVGASEPVLDDDLVTKLIARTPLRHGYQLVLIDLDAHGSTMPVAHPLFAAGAVATRRAVVTVPVVAPAAAGQPVVVAVVAGPDGTPPRQCRPVAITRCQLVAGQPHALAFRLDGPGRVTLTQPAHSRLDARTAETWPDLLDDIPARYQPDANAVDVVFGIELGGSQHELDRRRDLVVAVIRFIEGNHPDPDAVRVGIIGYREHQGQQRQNVLEVSQLGQPAVGREFAANLVRCPMIEPWNAPVEDALSMARRWMSWRPRPVARRFVLVGARPPYPPVDGSVARCPNGLNWSDELLRLEQDDVHHVAVWDRPPWSEKKNEGGRQAVAAWLRLGRPRPTMLLDRASPDLVATEAKTLGAATRPMPLLFPLAAGTRPQEDH